jgi:protein-tyrosine phosphatase
MSQPPLPWPGRLAIVARPRGGDWLEDEVGAWKGSGIRVVVSTLTADEIADFDLQKEKAICETAGIRLISFPIVDRGVPSSLRATLDLVTDLEARPSAGDNVAVHCRQGIGRSSLMAACVLASGAIDPETAFDRIQASRGCTVPETVEQRQWVSRFTHELALRKSA